MTFTVVLCRQDVHATWQTTMPLRVVHGLYALAVRPRFTRATMRRQRLDVTRNGAAATWPRGLRGGRMSPTHGTHRARDASASALACTRDSHELSQRRTVDMARQWVRDRA